MANKYTYMPDSSAGQNGSSWEKRVSSGQSSEPSFKDLSLRESANVKARPVALSQRLKQTATYLVNNPVDFMISAATSMATFMLVKNTIMMGLGLVAPPLLAGVIAAGLISMARATIQETKNRDIRVAELQSQNAPPSAADLASAKSINIAGIIESGIKHAAFSGLIGGLLGLAASPELHSHIKEMFHFNGAEHASNAGAIDVDAVDAGTAATNVVVGDYNTDKWNNLIDKIQDSEKVTGYSNELANGELGAYAFNEIDLVNAGYYEVDSDQLTNDWGGHWNNIDGIDSKEALLANPTIQDKIAHHLIESNAMENYTELDENCFFDDYVGKEVRGVTLNKDAIMAGAEKWGVGSFDDVGDYGNGGLAGELALDPSYAGDPSFKAYMEQFVTPEVNVDAPVDVPVDGQAPDPLSPQTQSGTTIDKVDSDKINQDSIKIDTPHADKINKDSIKIDTPHADKINKDSSDIEPPPVDKSKQDLLLDKYGVGTKHSGFSKE